MFTDFENLHDLLNNGIARVANNKLNNLLKNYSFIRISEKIIFDENHYIYQRINESKIMIIDNYNELNNQNNELNFILAFESNEHSIEVQNAWQQPSCCNKSSKT